MTANCEVSGLGRLGSLVADCDTAPVRLFETHSPSVILLCLVGGIGTFVLGLKFAIPFIVGVLAVAVGRALDNYGLKSGDE